MSASGACSPAQGSGPIFPAAGCRTRNNWLRQRPMTNSTSERGGFSAAKEGWLKQLARYPNLSGADYAVAIALSTYLNSKTHDAWPSMQRLAVDTNRSRATVWRSLKRLEALTLLDVIHARSNRKSNRYRPRLGKMNAEPEKLRRKTTPRGAMLRTRNAGAAKPQHTSCEPAARTSEESEMNSGKRGFRKETILSALGQAEHAC